MQLVGLHGSWQLFARVQMSSQPQRDMRNTKPRRNGVVGKDARHTHCVPAAGFYCCVTVARDKAVAARVESRPLLVSTSNWKRVARWRWWLRWDHPSIPSLPILDRQKGTAFLALHGHQTVGSE